MKKFFSVGMTTLGSLLLILILVFTVLQLVINDETFINNEFTKLEINQQMNMSNSDLVKSMNRLVDYMEGRADNIDVEVTVNGEQTLMFDLEQEATHMADVRTIYQRIRAYRDTGVLVMLILFLFGALVNFRKAPQVLAQGYLSGFFIALLFFGFLGTWAAMDFSSFWTFFHQMLFWNDLWLFDATESRMINMLPEQMFSDIVGRIFLYAGIAILVLLLVAIVAMIVSSAGYKRRHAEALKRKKLREQARAAKEQAKLEAQAQAERAKRIAKKKARKAELRKRQAKAEAAARRKAARQGKGTVRRATQPREERDDDDYDDDYDDLTGDSLLTGVQEETRDLPESAPIVDGSSTGRKRKKASRRNVEDDTGFLDE